MPHVLVEAERCAIRAYTEICDMTFGKDHRTCEVALAILHEKAEREACFSEYPGEGLGGHFRRRAQERRPTSSGL
jgi:ferritin-like protein